ncbi:unnamed protein product [Paramecium primaurelia]|uniref:Uncharacterized protein n=1 Tax=Paramecium primaurelia TaxID=5886 RepID=A0A8S1P9V7_PARPR|nr:unnamed protein product [Paramecium primaurelia]
MNKKITRNQLIPSQESAYYELVLQVDIYQITLINNYNIYQEFFQDLKLMRSILKYFQHRNCQNWRQKDKKQDIEGNIPQKRMDFQSLKDFKNRPLNCQTEDKNYLIGCEKIQN